MAARRLIILAMLVLPLLACGGGGGGADFYDDVPTGAPPIVVRVDPTSGAAGMEVTVFGLGFSIEVATNVVMMGSMGISADSYSILENPANGEVETITFAVPSSIAAGTYPVVVIVHDTASNADIEFTVTP